MDLTTPQWLSIGVVTLMMIAFIWGRFRYDIVAIAALLAGIAVGVVPAKSAFSGFSDDIVIIVGSALVVSATVARSGIMDRILQYLAPNITNVRIQLALLVIVVAFFSAIIKNIGALAIMMPIAFQFARRSNVSPSVFLMPMAFASLLGGLMTLIGTSPNIVVSRVREELTGKSFEMFDYTPVGLLLTLSGTLFLTGFYWLLPERRATHANLSDAIDINSYTVEAEMKEGSAAIGKTVAELTKMVGEEVSVLAIHRDGKSMGKPQPATTIEAADVLVMEGATGVIARLASLVDLSLTGQRVAVAVDEAGVTTVEAVVGEQSGLVGSSAKDLKLFDTHDVNIVAVSRQNTRIRQLLGRLRLRAGDIVVLQGSSSRLADFIRNMGMLPLIDRDLHIGDPKKGLLALGILAAAILLTVFGLTTVAVSFFGAAAMMMMLGIIPLRDMYRSVEGPILVMLAAIIPVSDSLRATGVTDKLGMGLAEFGAGLPAYGSLALIMVAAMAVTPFLNNAATVLVMAPIAAGFATNLGYQPEAFLMAVAVGAGCDFLTPVGHQCNTLVMAPGGYRFSDYSRLGLPLSILVVLLAVPALLWMWPP